MAQQDTGLGWSAKSDWLLSLTARLCDITNAVGCYELPYCPTDVDVITNGALWCTQQFSFLRETYVASTSANAKIYAFIYPASSGIGSTIRYFSATQSATVRVIRYNKTFSRIETTYTDYLNPAFTELPGYYYQTRDSGSTDLSYGPIDFYNSFADAIDNIDIETYSVYKLNAGFAVACVAKWASLAGDYLTTPVLISSDRNAVILSKDGSTEIADQMIASYLYDGMRFYMSFLNLRDLAFSNVTVENPDLSQFGAAQPEKVFKLLANSSYSNIQISNAPDPYEEQDGASEEDGGDGSEIENEPVLNDTHTVPTGGGFYKIFTPSLYQLGQLSQYMWGTLDLDNFKRIFSSPIDCILGLGIVPVSLTGTNSPVYLGGVDTQLSFPLVTDEVYDFDMGSVHIEKATGSYLDYAPYTKISVYLPFIGFRELDVDDVMDTYLTLKYRIDIATGACIARLSVMGTTLYQFSGSCLKQLPITGTNWDNAITGAISTAVSIGSTVASAGASAPVLAGAVASATTQALTTKSTAQRSGSLSATSGLLGGVVPYIVRTTPKEVIPANQNKYIGYPSYTTQSLGSLSGYNEIASIHLEGIPATGNELAEIETLLKGGVIL